MVSTAISEGDTIGGIGTKRGIAIEARARMGGARHGFGGELLEDARDPDALVPRCGLSFGRRGS